MAQPTPSKRVAAAESLSARLFFPHTDARAQETKGRQLVSLQSSLSSTAQELDEEARGHLAKELDGPRPRFLWWAIGVGVGYPLALFIKKLPLTTSHEPLYYLL